MHGVGQWPVTHEFERNLTIPAAKPVKARSFASLAFKFQGAIKNRKMQIVLTNFVPSLQIRGTTFAVLVPFYYFKDIKGVAFQKSN